VNGDEVRDVRFTRGGYDAGQVDELLGRIAVDLDAGRPAGPLIANATFGEAMWGFDINAVDWFLDQLARSEDPVEPTVTSADPWRDLAVVNYLARSGPGGLADRVAARSRRGRFKYITRERKHLARECAAAWRAFGQQPGTQLRWGPAGATRRELRTQ
jgi:DivIVA domain-containing protein